ncbi:UDP-4-amino-4,6-dideoxy-N-acetyl-beta-L-altrosamine transaminase [Neisseria sp. Ec49-e6-T10]|uniref:UDP-4-amino-4, 6-dideoxy-N-acetyl-beta-L-altrosamine transaminase n=1 Tax=Neisseria sp. Ec49-e6-T10 TaxID=3140744 RepID=UPI003EBEE84A
MIPYGKQDIHQEDIEAIVQVLRSDFLTQGPKVPLFEQNLCQYTGASYAFAVNSATSALHIACLALGLGAGDILWTSTISFVASSNCALYCGAHVDFVDIDPQTYNMSVVALEQKLIEAQKNNCLPKIVVPVHLCGQSCDMQAIFALSKQYGFRIIEDASHAIGAKYQGLPVGDCRYSDITVFSFHPVKIITTAEGGAALTNDPKLAQKMNLLRSHGITRDENLMTEKSHGAWFYQQVDLGFNYRMTELQAALGISQLTRLDQYVASRHKKVEIYNQAFSSVALQLPYQNNQTYSSYHLYPILVNEQTDRAHLFNVLRQANIGVNVHYIPIHTQPYYQQLGFKWGDFPEAENYYKRAISLPLYAQLSDTEQNYVIEQVCQNIK